MWLGPQGHRGVLPLPDVFQRPEHVASPCSSELRTTRGRGRFRPLGRPAAGHAAWGSPFPLKALCVYLENKSGV